MKIITLALCSHPRRIRSQGCATCFELGQVPRARGAAGAATNAKGKPGSRGLSTAAGDVFQVISCGRPVRYISRAATKNNNSA